MLIKGIRVNPMLNISVSGPWCPDLWGDFWYMPANTLLGKCDRVYFWPHIHTHMCALSFPWALCEGCCGANGNEVPSCVPAVAPSYTQWPLCVCGGTIPVAIQCDFTFCAYSNLLHDSLEYLISGQSQYSAVKYFSTITLNCITDNCAISPPQFTFAFLNSCASFISYFTHVLFLLT